jgi:hypothetical protein
MPRLLRLGLARALAAELHGPSGSHASFVKSLLSSATRYSTGTALRIPSMAS